MGVILITINILTNVLHKESMRLALSSNPCTRLLNLPASIFLSNTCCAGIFFRGNHTLVDFISTLLLFNSDKSTTLGDDENLITSLYSNLVSVAKVRSDGGVRGSSDSDSSVSELLGGSRGRRGGVRLVDGVGSGVRASISRRRSWPLRKLFSLLRNLTVPRSASIYEES